MGDDPRPDRVPTPAHGGNAGNEQNPDEIETPADALEGTPGSESQRTHPNPKRHADTLTHLPRPRPETFPNHPAPALMHLSQGFKKGGQAGPVRRIQLAKRHWPSSISRSSRVFDPW